MDWERPRPFRRSFGKAFVISSPRFFTDNDGCCGLLRLAERHPFVVLTAALAGGILAGWRIEGPSIGLTGLFVVVICAAIVGYCKQLTRATSVGIIISVTAAGSLLAVTESARREPPRVRDLFAANVFGGDQAVDLTGCLTALPDPAPGLYFLDIDVESLAAAGQVLPAVGRVRLGLPVSDPGPASEFARLNLDAGSRIRVLVRLEKARSYANPGSPDFNEFLELQGYDLKGTIKSSLLIETLGAAPANPLMSAAGRLRRGGLDAIDRRFSGSVAGTLKAMLLGNRYYLDSEASSRLRDAGTFHVISISGMHVALIAWLLQGRKKRYGIRRIARAAVSLFVLWIYAVTVGLNPPVSRATLMITIALVGPVLFRRAVSANTVSLAAFVMLAVQPSLLRDPGFQLSFVAVAAIVGLALPLQERLREIGQWRPTPRTPYPPRGPRALRWCAEALFWNDREFRKEMAQSPVRYGLDKASAARRLGRLRLQPVLRAVFLLVSTSAAIQLATLPLTAVYFNRVTPIGVLLNIPAGLLTAALMFCGAAAIALGELSAVVGSVLAVAGNLAHSLLVFAIEPFRNWPGASFRVAHYEGWWAVLYLIYFIPVGITGWMIARWSPLARDLHPPVMPISGGPTQPGDEPSASGWKGRVHSPWGVLSASVLLLAGTTLVMRPPAPSPDGTLTIHFLDVAQGDSALIVFPGGSTMLVDGGGERRFDRSGSTSIPVPKVDEEDAGESLFSDNGFSIGESVVSRFLWSKGLLDLDYVLNTHADLDHMGGLPRVVRNFRVHQAITGRIPSSNLEYAQYRRLIDNNRIPLTSVHQGDRFLLEGVEVEVLWPPAPDPAEPASSGNNDSVVLRLTYGSTSVLLTGDIEGEVEQVLVDSGTDLSADILKVPHHGSKTSSTGPFVAAVKPECAIISVGARSPFGHPHRTVVDRYLSAGTRLFQTGTDGTVSVRIGPRGYHIATFKSNRD